MNLSNPCKIIHLDLSRGVNDLVPDGHNRSLYIILWWKDVPLGEIKLLASDLPLTEPQLAGLSVKAISPAVKAYLDDGNEEVLTPLSPEQGTKQTVQKLRNLIKIKDPLVQIEEKVSVRDWSGLPVSVVICTRNRTSGLNRCLDSLLALNERPHEIIVVDNAPDSDETCNLIRKIPDVQYVYEKRKGLDYARNAGIISASGDIIAFVDDDVVVHEKWLYQLGRAFRDNEVMAVTGLVLPAELESKAQCSFENHWSFNRGYKARVYGTPYFESSVETGVPAWEVGAGASMAFRRKVFELAGYFDERLDVGAAGCSGDSELWYRVVAGGWKCRYEPSAVVYHYHRRKWQDFESQIFHYMRGHVSALLIQFEKYRHKGNLRRLTLGLPRYYLRFLLKRVVKGHYDRFETVCHEIAGCLSGIKFYLLNNKILSNKPGAIRQARKGPVKSSEDDSERTGRGRSEKPLVSVVIPCYQQGHTLADAIESVMSQTYDNVETVVVDDGSTDSTGSVAERYPGVIYVRQNNRGLSGARNRGLSECSGRYVVFLDADDRLLPYAIQSGLNCFRANPGSGLVYGSHAYITSDGSTDSYKHHNPSRLDTYLAKLRSDKDAFRALLFGNYIGMHAAVMYRKDLINRLGGFDEALDACEDYDMYFRVARERPISFHDDVVAEYRMHGNTMTGNPQIMFRSVMHLMNSQRKYLTSGSDYEAAFQSGKKFWVEYYGYDLMHQVKSDLLKGETDRAVSGMLSALRYAPCWFTDYLVKYFERTARAKAEYVLSRLQLHRTDTMSSFHEETPAPGSVEMEDLRSLEPLGRGHKCCNDNSVSGYYEKRFFNENHDYIKGDVLVVGNSEVNDIVEISLSSKAGLMTSKEFISEVWDDYGEIQVSETLTPGCFDCIACVRTLHHIEGISEDLGLLSSLIRPGGVMLATFSGVSSNSNYSSGQRPNRMFTARSASALIGHAFPGCEVVASSFGNILTASSALHGIPFSELTGRELDYDDPMYPVVVTVKVVKI